MKEAMFKDAKVGDKVWSVQEGWGEISQIAPTSAWPVRVEFPNKNSNSYTFDGKEYECHDLPTLFWDEVKIDPPPRPKRKGKRVLEGWVNIYPAEGWEGLRVSNSYPSRAIAAEAQGPDCVGQHHIHHEWEVEESYAEMKQDADWGK